jgi:hypothetical protein
MRRVAHLLARAPKPDPQRTKTKQAAFTHLKGEKDAPKALVDAVV